MDSNGLLERDGARGILNADEGWPELQIHRGRRAGVPSDRGSGLKAPVFFRITFPERGKPVLSVGPGDHTVQRWELSMDDLKSLVRDALPELLR